MAIQSDDKIIAVGFASGNFLVIRYNADGTIDTSFGGGDGIVATDFSGNEDIAYDVKIQSDGKILVTGPTISGLTASMALVRYLSNGDLDTSFATGGKATLAINSSNTTTANSIIIQSDGKIILAGFTQNSVSSSVDFAVVRYDSDGTLDTTFETDGITVTPIGTTTEASIDSALQSDGKIIVVGYVNDGNDNDPILARYFGGGVTVTQARASSFIQALINKYS